MADQDALVAVFARNNFYRRLHYLALGAFALAILVIVILTSVFYFLSKNPTQPVYFATDNVGRLLNIIPVDQANMSMDDMADWVREAIEDAYSYDYINYRRQLQHAQRYFADSGWQAYVKALVASNNLVALKERKMVIVAKLVDKPTLVTPGRVGQALAWKFTMPVLATYYLPPYDDKSSFANSLQVTVIVQRLPILQSDRGLGITQIISTFAAVPANQTPEITATPTGG